MSSSDENRLKRLEHAIFEMIEYGLVIPCDRTAFPNAMAIHLEVYEAPIKKKQKEDEIAEYVRLKKKYG